MKGSKKNLGHNSSGHVGKHSAGNRVPKGADTTKTGGKISKSNPSKHMKGNL